MERLNEKICRVPSTLRSKDCAHLTSKQFSSRKWNIVFSFSHSFLLHLQSPSLLLLANIPFAIAQTHILPDLSFLSCLSTFLTVKQNKAKKKPPKTNRWAEELWPRSDRYHGGRGWGSTVWNWNQPGSRKQFLILPSLAGWLSILLGSLFFFFVCLFKIQVTRRTVSGGATEWLTVVNCILCAADH